MTSNTSLPSVNTLEELLVIRVALDWEDVYKNKSEYYKQMSKLFIFVETLLGILIAFYSTYVTMVGHVNPFQLPLTWKIEKTSIPDPFKKGSFIELPEMQILNSAQTIEQILHVQIENIDLESTILFFLAMIATFEQAMFAYVNPNARWATLKTSERLINTEIWKFRCRMGDYSIEKFSSSTILRNMTNFTTELSTQTMAKAKLQESNLMGSYSHAISTHQQYQSWFGENYRMKYNHNEIENKDADLMPLDSNLIGDYEVEDNIVDNH